MSLKELPYSHFKVAVEELNHRYKVCVALGSLIEELSEVGSAAGKNLSKLGTQNFLTGNQQWLPTCSVALESIHKMTTSSSGKQLVGHASNLSQNISKTFPEQVRLGKKRVVALAVKIGNQVDEYKKAKLLHSKNAEKYQRLASDTEAAIRSRAAANEIESRSSSDKESVVVQGDNFMTRSLNKMVSKIAPEKKIDDRCRDMVRELDVHERAVVASNKRLVVMRSDLMGEITKAMSELEELESQRLHFMREGMSRFCLAAELIGNQQSEVITSVLERTNKLVANDEAIQVMKEIDRPSNANGNSPVKKRSESTDSEDEADTGAELAVLFGKAEKLGEALDYFRSLVARATNSMLEVAEVEATYYRSAHKVLDRHGYCRNAAAQWVYAADHSTIPLLAENTPMKSAPLSAAIGAVGATTMALTSNLRSAEYLSRFESPSTKGGWEQVVNSVGNFADLQLRASEVAGDDVCQQLELVTQRLEIGRKELMEKLAQNSKMVENAKQEVKKVTLKLTKCQSLLRERRDTLKQVKDILIADSASTLDSTEAPSAAAVAAAAAVTAQQERDGVGSPDSSSVLGSTLDEPLNSPAPVSGDSYSRKQGIFRKGGLKQVVGLETQADRVSRIEKQVATLEEEEKDLVEALASAEQALVHFTNVAKTQVMPIFDATREFISTDLVTMKHAIEVFMSWKSDSLASFRTVNRVTKKAHDDIDISRDLVAFSSAVQTAAEGISRDQSGNPSLNAQMATALNGNGIPLSLLDVPEIEPFAVVNSDLINQEREVISKLPPVSSTLYSISNLAMNYGGNSDAADGVSPGPSGYSVFKTRDRKGTEDSLTSTGGTVAVLDTPLPIEAEVTSPVDSNGNVTLQTPVPLDSAGLELAKFGLTNQDKVMESYSCALYPKKGLLTHGRMFVTQHYLAFSGWPETRVLLLVRNIKEVNRMNTLYYVPNALSVVMLDETEYFFGSFIDREQCYALLVSLNDVGKHMASLPDFDPTTDERNLEFGYLTQNNLFGGASEIELAAAQAQDDAANSPGGVRASPGGLRSPSPAALAGATTVRSATPTKPIESPTKMSMMSKFTGSAAKAAPPLVTPVKVKAESPLPTPQPQPQPQAVVVVPPPVSAPVVTAPAHTAAQATVTASKTTTTTTTSVTNNTGTSSLTTTTSSSTFAVETKPIEVDLEVVEDGINQSTLYERSNIALMQEKVFSIPTADIWQQCWAHAKGYGQFLLEEGEIEITFTEWVPCASPKALEDLAKLNFCFCRKYDYLHPRTTMLMFGPKNAPTSQMQYLYLPIGNKKIPPADLNTLRPTRGVVFTCTTLQGIPMCDVFKVLQYWSFERHGGDAGRTEMKVGMGIHYLKSSMFKAQIYNGTKEELILQSLKWLHYAERCCLSKQALPAGIELVEEPTIQATLPGSGEKVQVRRSSLRRMSEPEHPVLHDHALASSGAGSVAESATAAVAALSAAATTTTSIDVSLGASEAMTTSSGGAVKHEKSVTVAAATKTVAPAVAQQHGEFALQMHVDVNYILIILACAVVILLVLLYRQSSYNSALVQQINLLSRKIEMSQTAMEISMRQSQSVVHKMESFINNIQK